MNFEELYLRIYGDPVLRRRSDEVEEFGPELHEMAERMYEVMYEQEGIGLAAPQVGVNRRMMVLDVPLDDGERFRGVVINPEILETRGNQEGEEGCLSIPGLREIVVRDDELRVRARDADGESFEFTCNQLLSRALQHEIDHLDGIFFVDRLSPLRRRLLAKKLRQIAEDREEEAAPGSHVSGLPG